MTKHFRSRGKSGYAGTAIVLFMVAGPALSGCVPIGVNRSISKRAATKADRKRVEFKSEKGKLVIDKSNRRLPARFSADMPVYKPSIVKSLVSSRGSGEATMTMLILSTEAKIPGVAAFYRKRLTVEGWTIDSSRSLNQGAISYAVTKADRAGSISIGRDIETSGTIISINIATR